MKGSQTQTPKNQEEAYIVPQVGHNLNQAIEMLFKSTRQKQYHNKKYFDQNMNSFDPFVSAEYQKTIKEQNPMEQEALIPQKSESQYISQLLSSCFSGTSKQITVQTEVELSLLKSIQDGKSESESIIVSQSSGSSKKSSKNSPFHNFQKHLVITLRQILTLKVLSEKMGSQYELAAKIFGYFKKSQKTSKSILEQVFGLYQIRDQNSKAQFIKNLKKGELSTVLENYSDETIQQAQEILKHFSKMELEECQILDCLSRRKIQKKQEFIEYMGLFKRELVEGKQRKKAYKLLAKKFKKSGKIIPSCKDKTYQSQQEKEKQE